VRVSYAQFNVADGKDKRRERGVMDVESGQRERDRRGVSGRMRIFKNHQ
jgi:hypothetical protein